MTEDEKTKVLKGLMGSINPAEMQKVNQVMETIAEILGVLPPIEVKHNYIRTFVNEDPKQPPTKKEYIAIFIEKPQKAKA
jgi:hypothetical protein